MNLQKSYKMLSVVFIICILWGANLFSNDMSVKLTSPHTKTRFDECANILLKAEINIDESLVKRLRFYKNGIYIGYLKTAPWEYTWENATPGIYEITAQLVDVDNNVVNSEPALIFVGEVEDGEKMAQSV